ncbi:hypothetical protein Tco_0783128 [Tanacetum coccineum]
MVEYSQKWHNGTFRVKSTETSDELAAIQAQLNNLGREIKKFNEKVYAAQAGCEQCKGPHYTKDYLLKEEDAAIRNQGASIKTLEIQIRQMSKDIKVPLILERPFLSTAHLKMDVFKQNITLKVGDKKIIFKSIKPASSLIKRVNMLSLRKQMELDLEVRLMGETLVLKRSLDPFYGDYIELNDFNVPLELRRDQVNYLMPTIEEGEVVYKPMIEEVKARNDNEMVSKVFGYPSDYN